MNEDLALVATRLLGWQYSLDPMAPQGNTTQRYWHDPKVNHSVRKLAWLLTGDGMLEVLKALTVKGWKYDLASNGNICVATVESSRIKLTYGPNKSLPETVIRAAASALRQEEGK